MSAHISETQLAIADDIAGFYDDPVGFVWYAFPWGEGALANEKPDKWQVELLTRLGEEVKRRGNGAIAEAIQIAVASGHGIGKSALISWLILWFISTRPHPQIVCTANTSEQLIKKTWRELSKWHKLAINKDWFTWSATKFYMTEHAADWFAAAIPWSKENPEAFAGTHEKDVLVLYDEASAIPDVIWEVTEGAMTTPGAVWVVFGNPTRNTGRFRECFGRLKHRWLTWKIDSRTVSRTNKAQIKQWEEDYGEDSDFFRVRVKADFPRAGSTQFISSESVTEAQKRYNAGDKSQPLLMGVDVARFGEDQTVFRFRQGRECMKYYYSYRGKDTMETASLVLEKAKAHGADKIFIDGAGVGGGVVDRCRQLGLPVLEVNAGSKARNDTDYANLRAEMWGLMRDWLATATLPEDSELAADLEGVEYGFTARNQIQLEKKEDMKKRGLSSPDHGDALALTFAMPVGPKAKSNSRIGGMPSRAIV